MFQNLDILISSFILELEEFNLIYIPGISSLYFKVKYPLGAAILLSVLLGGSHLAICLTIEGSHLDICLTRGQRSCYLSYKGAAILLSVLLGGSHLAICLTRGQPS